MPTVVRPLFPLDERHYNLAPDDAAFFKKQTGIDDDEAMKRHILALQAEAYNIHPYPCITFFSFTKTSVNKLPPYQHVINLGRNRPGAILLEMGCFFGTAIRKVVVDGYPVNQIVASDLHSEFWDLGHKLFKSTPSSFPVHFVAGDALDPSFLPSLPFLCSKPSGAAPSLNSLTSLAPLRGRTSVIFAASFFHLFDEEKQLQLAKAFAGLLSPEPGSVIFGFHVAHPEPGLKCNAVVGTSMFCHSPESWGRLWKEQVFTQGSVTVEASLKVVDVPVIAATFHLMTWSVKRV